MTVIRMDVEIVQKLLTELKLKDPAYYFTKIYPYESKAVREFAVMHYVRLNPHKFRVCEKVAESWEEDAMLRLSDEELDFVKKEFKDVRFCPNFDRI